MLDFFLDRRGEQSQIPYLTKHRWGRMRYDRAVVCKTDGEKSSLCHDGSTPPSRSKY